MDHRVGEEAERDVEQEHQRGEHHALRDALPEEQDDQHPEEGRCDGRAVDRAAPRGRLVEPLLAPLLSDLLGFVGGAGTARPAGALDGPGRGAPVLAAALALGLRHWSDGPYSSAARASSRMWRSGEKPRSGTSWGNP